MEFGEHPPALSLDEVLTASDGMRQVRAAGGRVYWLASVVADNSRGTVRYLDEGAVIDATPTANVRSRVNEYGGGAYDVDDARLVFVDDRSGTLQLIELATGEQRSLSRAEDSHRFGGLCLTDRYVVAVRETPTSGEPRTELVRLGLGDDNPGGGEVIATGADFYGYPAASGDQVAWVQWNHPNMPWDASEVWQGDVTDLSAARRIAGGDGVSALHPRWLSDQTLAYLSDEHGYWNLHAGETVIADPHDFCPAPWVQDRAPLVEVRPGLLLGLRYVAGAGQLVKIDLTKRSVEQLADTADVESIAAADGVGYVIAQWADRPPSLECVVAGGLEELLGAQVNYRVVTPESVWFGGPAGATHAWYYPAPDIAEGAPPLLVETHGGPTAMVTPSYDPTVQYWVSIGVSVLEVNYSGSSGFGRLYRDRLVHNWGVLDVADCVAAVDQLAEQGRIDPTKVAISGGSAGGYTTLQALVVSDTFAAGISRYGIGDLSALAQDTHKFESRYMDAMVGPYPAARATYWARSPIHHVANLSTPMLILQGADDLVVPPNQAEAMARALRDKKLPVSLIIFPGEGHGFRMLANRRVSLESQLSFLSQVFGFDLADPVPPLSVENL